MNHFIGPALAQKDHRASHAKRAVPTAEGAAADTTRAAPLHAISRGQGMHVWDKQGMRLLDGVSGLCNAVGGYGHPALGAAAAAQISRLRQGGLGALATQAALSELSARLLSILPQELTRVCHTGSGAQANALMQDCAQAFWQVAGRASKRIVIRQRQGHPNPLGSAAAGLHHIAQPYWFGYHGYLTEYEFGQAAAGELEAAVQALGAEHVAAFIAEPFQTNGMIYPPYGYWPEIQRICRQYDMLLCIDEAAGCLGRSGKWFASDHFGIQADAIALGEGLSSGYAPVGALALSGRLADALAQGGMALPIAGGQRHALGCAMALAALHLLDEGGLAAQVGSDTGLYFQYCLRERFNGHPLAGEIQGSGMVAALQLTPGPGMKARFDQEHAVGALCVSKALANGLLVDAAGARIVLTPALIASHAHIDELIDKLGRAVNDTAIALHLA